MLIRWCVTFLKGLSRQPKVSVRKRLRDRIEVLERRRLLSAGPVHQELALSVTFPHEAVLSSWTDYLSAPATGDPLQVAFEFLDSHTADLGLSPSDLAAARVTDNYVDEFTGTRHIYLQQSFNGLPVVNTSLSINLTADGRVINVGSQFVPDLSGRGMSPQITPRLNGEEAVVAAAASLGFEITMPAIVTDRSASLSRSMTVSAAGVSLDPIPVDLVYVPDTDGVRLAWHMVVRTPDGQHWIDLGIDADQGRMLYGVDWVDHASYHVFAMPTESPQDGFRQNLTNTFDPAASPFGWQDIDGTVGAEYSDTRGNNVFAQTDHGDDNYLTVPTEVGLARPFGDDELAFDFPLDLTQSPFHYENAAVTNLFVMNNVLHDLHYKYGFTSSAGNFQFNRYEQGGTGNDPVFADVLDGDGINNANFATPPDGTSPRMQMYQFDKTNPYRDSDLDNGVIIHEYGHGVSNRLTGGPANANALEALQSAGMGEGWSDWWALMFLQRPSDTQFGSYTIGTYLFGQPTNGPGIRTYPYSYDMTVNPHTLADFNTSSEVHDTGEIWCSALWDMNWLLINKYGYDPNMSAGYAGAGSAGNILALQLVMDALKLQPANPTFFQSRDAILSADLVLTGGANQREIWNAFARRGMGASATTTNSDSPVVTSAFDLPSALGFGVTEVTPTPLTAVSTPPTEFVVHFSNPYTAASVAAADLKVNGIAATSFTLTTADTVTFTFSSSPVTTEGLQTIALSAGSISRLGDGSNLLAYTAKFRYDALPLSVMSLTPSNGSSVSPGLSSLTVQVNEAYDPATIGTEDLQTSQGTVTGFTLVNATTVQYSLRDVANEGTFAYVVADGAIRDLNGNPLSQFTGNLVVDVNTLPLTLLESMGAAGSLIYQTSVGRVNLSSQASRWGVRPDHGYQVIDARGVGDSGDTDNYTITLNAGQTISVLVTPVASLIPTINLIGPETSASTSAPLAGGFALINSISVNAAGTYTLTIGGAAGTAGDYEFQLYVNSTLEVEQYSGSSNDTRLTGQNLDTRFTTLDGVASRAAVLGTSPAGFLPNEIESHNSNNTPATANLATYNFVASTGKFQMGLLGNIATSSDVDYYNLGTLQSGDLLRVNLAGAYSGRGTLENLHAQLFRGSPGSLTQVTFANNASPFLIDMKPIEETLPATDTYYLAIDSVVPPYSANPDPLLTGTYELGIFLEATGIGPSTGGNVVSEAESNDSAGTATNVTNSWHAVQFAAQTTGTYFFGDGDVYEYHFTAGDIVSVIGDGVVPYRPLASILDAFGAVLLGPASNFQSTKGDLLSYIVPTTGSYFIELGHEFSSYVDGGQGYGTSVRPGVRHDYDFTVYLSGAAPAAPPPPDDYYSFTLQANESVTLALQGLDVGGFTLELQNGSGNSLAVGTTGATNVDCFINSFTVATQGVYYARVTGPSLANYSLIVTKNATFNREGNDSLASAQSLAGARGVVGSVSASGPGRLFMYGDTDNNRIYEFNPVTGAIPHLYVNPLPRNPGNDFGMGTTPTSLLIGSSASEEILELNPDTGAVLRTIPNPGIDVVDIAFLNDEIFLLTKNPLGQIIVLNYTTGAVSRTLATAPIKDGLGASGNALYGLAGSTLYRIDPLTGAISRRGALTVIDEPKGMGIIGNELYVATSGSYIYGEQVTVFDLSTLSPVRLLSGSTANPAGLGADGGVGDEDYYSVSVAAGSVLTASTKVFDVGSLGFLNNLDLALDLYDPSGVLLASDDNSAGGTNARIDYPVSTTGTYSIRVRGVSGAGEYYLRALEFPNTAPVLVDSALSMPVTVEGGPGPVGPVGLPISSLVDLNPPGEGRNNVTDSDLFAVTGLAVTQATTNAGTWYYSMDNGANWSLLEPVSDAAARLLPADGNVRIYFQPGADFHGTLTNALTFRAWDQQMGIAGGLGDTTLNGESSAYSTATDTISVTVTPVGDTPVVNNITTLEDSQSGLIVINRYPLDGPEVTHFRISGITGGTLYYNNGTTQIQTGDYITFAAGQSGLRFTPSPNSNATGHFDVESSEDGSTVAAQSGKTTSSITITPVGDTPTVASITTLEDIQSGLIVINRNALDGSEVTHFRISGISGGTLYYNNGTTQIQNGDYITFAAGQAGVKFTPAAESVASGRFDVEASQNGSTIAAQSGKATSTITVTPVNDLPTITAIPNPASIPEDSGMQSVPVNGISAGGGEAQSLSLTASSNNSTLIPDPAVTYTSGNSTATLTYAPTANRSGTATITVNVRDAGFDGIAGNGDDATVSISFVVTVQAVNDPPTVDAIADPSAIPEDGGTQTISLTGISAGGGEVQTLSLVATSNNQTLIPNPVVMFTSPNSTATLSYTPSANRSGTVTITVALRDAGLDGTIGNGDDAAFTITFVVTVLAVNDSPTLSAISDPAAIPEDSGIQIVGVSGIGAGGGETQALVVTAISSNPALIPDPAVTYTSPNSTASLSYTPVANQNGTSTITATVRDAGLDGIAGNADDGIVTRQFVVTVLPVNDPPTAIELSSTSVSENQPAGTVVGAFSTLDPDTGNSFTYALTTGTGSADNASFEIVGNQLRTKTSFSFETRSSYSIRVRATDQSGLSVSSIFEITILDSNDPPTDVSLQNAINNLAENADTGPSLLLANIVVADDGVGTNALSLTGTDASVFQIVGTQLHFQTGVMLDYESKSTYSVTIRVDDAAVGTSPDASVVYTLTVSDVNEPPSAIALQNVTESLSEAADTSTAIPLATIAVTDDALGTNTLSLFGVDIGMFEIVGNQLRLKAGALLNFEAKTAYSITVDVNDPSVGDTPDASLNYTLQITNANDAPTGLLLQNTIGSLPENANTTSGIKVADVVVQDDGLGTNNLTLTGSGAPVFEIIGTSLWLKAGTVLNFEAQASYVVTIRVDDSAVGISPDATQGFTLAVTNVNEPPTLTLQNVTTTLAEHIASPNTVKLANAVVTDDGLGLNSLSIVGPDAGAFEIVGTELRLRSGVTLDFATKVLYSITINADDSSLGGNPDSSTGYSLSVIEVNDPPTLTLQNIVTTLSEDSSTGTAVKVADVVVTDDALGTNTLSLSGTDVNLFQIVGNELRLRAGAALNFEAGPILQVQVNVNDPTVGNNPDASRSYTLTLIDVNEPPLLALQNVIATLPENFDTAGVTLAELAVIDDVLGTNILSLSGSDANSFEIIGSALRLKAGIAADFETKSTFQLSISLDDPAVGSTPDTSQNYTLTLTDINEPPTAVALQNVIILLPETSNTSTAIVLADIQVTDDAIGTNLLTLAGPDAASFEIVANQLRLKAGTVLVWAMKSSYNLSIQTNDPNVGGAPDASVEYTLTIEAVPQAPTSIALAPAVVFENAAGAVVGSLSAVDPNPADTITFSIQAGGNGSLFTIVGNQLRVEAAGLDYESLSGRATVNLRATDQTGLFCDQAVTITVLDANDPPAVAAGQMFQIGDNALVGAPVGTVIVSDQDTTTPNRVVTIAITDGNLGNTFRINPASGIIEVQNPTALDVTTQPNYSLQITATDGGGLSTQQTLDIEVVHVIIPPQLDINGPAATWVKKQPPVQVLPALTVTGSDVGGGLLTLQVSIVRTPKRIFDTFSFGNFSTLGTTAGSQIDGSLLTLQVQLKDNVTADEIQAILRETTFITKRKGMKTSIRTLQMHLTDANNLTSTVSQVINVRKSMHPRNVAR